MRFAGNGDKMISDKLIYRGRYLRTHAGKSLLGPTGMRLFADYLEHEPGFTGRIDFIHKLNITSLFKVKSTPAFSFETSKSVWRPAWLETTFESDAISFKQIRWITEDDCALSLQTWKNKTDQPLVIEMDTGAQGFEPVLEMESGCRLCVAKETGHGFACGVAVISDCGLESGPMVIDAGGERTFTVAAGVGNLETESMEEIIQRAKVQISKGENALSDHISRYERFFQQAPTFSSSDPVLDKAWAYRWFILRHNLARPDFGNLQGHVMYEGRSHKKTKEPFAKSGWEFSKLVNLSTPLHLTDMRWHGNRRYGYDIIMNMLGNTNEDGLFCSAYVDSRLSAYANFGVWAVYLFWLADGNIEIIKEILPGLKSYIAAETKVYSAPDGLQIERQHNKTGKEYQPGYWYFHGFHKNPKDPDYFTPLKRVDRSVYHYLNLLGLSRLCGAAGDSAGEKRYLDEAKLVKGAILEKMWDKDSEFFYDLHHMTDEKALVKHIVGVYPHWAGIAGEENLSGLEKLFGKEYFNTTMPFPSVAKDSPVYCPSGGWQGNYIKGRDGCVWCGPQWPYTTGIAVDAIGRQSRQNSHRYDAQFGEYLRKYALAHFRDYDLERPYLVEHYNPETGELLSDEVDYCHSYFLDLIVRYVAGVELSEDGTCFDPLDIGLDHFALENLIIRGKRYDIYYQKGGEKGKRAENYRVLCDGVPMEI